MPESNNPTISKYIEQLTPAVRQGLLNELNELEEELNRLQTTPRSSILAIHLFHVDSTKSNIAYITDILNRNGYEID